MLFLVSVTSFPAYAVSIMYAEAAPPEVDAEAAILYEVTSGSVLYEKNAYLQKMYPASLTKIMTAMVALDYIQLDDIITVGSEINSLPGDASRTRHKEGESILAKTLVRALFLSSGNDSACVLAMETGRRLSGDPNISYSDAVRLFCGKMNEKALELGAYNTSFVNPHGYHNDRHYTTALDFALITEAALSYPLIAQVSKEKEFSGNGAGDDYELYGYALTQDYSWKNGNLLISGEYAYNGATGMRTGQTDEAGSCLAATAERDGKILICVLLNGSETGRWTDTANLFDYGFDNFDYVTILEAGKTLGEIPASNTPLGEESAITYYAAEGLTGFFSDKQLEDIHMTVFFNPELLYVPKDTEEITETSIAPPVNEGDVIGMVSYFMNDELLFSCDIVANNSVVPRTFNTDVDYYILKIRDIFFTMYALPYWIIAALLSGILIYVIRRVRIRIKEKRKGYKFKSW